MSHIHKVTDTDVHYKIDGILRTITNIDETKRMLVQNDHNSERLTFEVPRYIDDHDFSECNSVQVHYINSNVYKNNQSIGIYEVNDLHVSDEDENTVLLSWLVSSNATKFVGSLSFVIRFSCVEDDGTVTYAWNTTTFEGITIQAGIYNSDAVAEQYADVLEEWKRQLIENGVSDEQLENAINEYLELNPITPPTVSDETIRRVVLQSTVHEVTDNNVNAIVPNSPVSSKAVAEELKDFTDNNLFNKLLKRLGLTLEDLKESLPKVYITGDITGISAENYVDVKCQYVNAYNQTEFTDYATIAWQGSSSLNFPVKNYKIKLFTDEEREEKSKRTFKDWHATNNYHLKANFGDCTNFMNNMMMHYLTKSYQYLEPLPRENARYTVDGFPILLYVNNEFSGIYFWNLKQDDKIYNLNEEKVDESGNVIQEADLCYQAGRADNYNNAGNNSCAFVYGALTANGKNFADAHAEIDHYWEDRVWDKVSNHPDVLYDTIQWVSEATDEEFKANLANYFDVDYLINYFVCMYTCGMIDSKAKNFNMLYFPEKGIWYPTFWDMDKAFGSGFNTGTVPHTIKFTPETSAVYEFDAPANRLFDKLIANFWEECCAKYKELRETLFTVEQVEDSVNAVWGLATAEMIAENKAVKYDGTSYTGFKTDGASFVVDWAEQRFAFMDKIFTQDNEEVITGAYAKGYIDNTGNINTSTGIYGIDYLPINNLSKIALVSSNKFYNWRVAFYDKNKNFVRRVTATNPSVVYGTTAIDVQSGETYVRFSCEESISDSSYTQGIFDNLCVVYPPENEYVAVDTFDTYKTSYVENYTREYALVMLSDFRILGNSNIQVVANEGYQIRFEPVFSNITSGYNDSDQLRSDVVLNFDTTDLTDVLTITNGWQISGVRLDSVCILVKKDDSTAFSIDDRPFFVVEGAVNLA
jgi:hypothetical protein